MSAAPSEIGVIGWAILELMGHRRLAGYVREVELFGVKQCRIDIPAVLGEDGATEVQPPVTQFYGGGAVYCLTPTTEEIARAVGRSSRPAPVHPFEIQRPQLTGGRVPDDEFPEVDEEIDNA